MFHVESFGAPYILLSHDKVRCLLTFAIKKKAESRFCTSAILLLLLSTKEVPNNSIFVCCVITTQNIAILHLYTNNGVSPVLQVCITTMLALFVFGN